MDPQDIYQRYGGVVFRRARRILGNEQSARDACQEVFLRLFQALPEFQRASPVTWLYKVTTNHCLNVLRDEQRRRKLLETRLPAASPVRPPELPALLAGFPDELQDIAVYYFVDEMSQEEIARLLGISQRTVSNRLSAFRGLARTVWAADLVEGT